MRIISVTGNLGTLNVKISNFSLCQRGNGFSQLCGLRIWKGQRPRQYAGLVMSEQSKKVISMCRGSLLETSCKFFYFFFFPLFYSGLSFKLHWGELYMSLPFEHKRRIKYLFVGLSGRIHF